MYYCQNTESFLFSSFIIFNNLVIWCLREIDWLISIINQINDGATESLILSIKVKFSDSSFTYFLKYYSIPGSMQQSMEFVVIEEVLMALMAATKRWILNKISYLIKSKWYNQNEVTRELYLDKESKFEKLN